MKNVRFVVFAVSLVVAGSVLADGYIGAGFGRSDVDISDSGVSFSDTDTGWKLFAGYEFNKNFAVEGAWVDLGQFSDTVFVPLLAGTAPVKLEIDGLAVSGVGSLPVGEAATVFARLGIWSWNTDSSTLGISTDDDGTDVMFGFGGSYRFTDQISARAEWERYKADSDDADLISVSGVFHF